MQNVITYFYNASKDTARRIYISSRGIDRTLAPRAAALLWVEPHRPGQNDAEQMRRADAASFIRYTLCTCDFVDKNHNDVCMLYVAVCKCRRHDRDFRHEQLQDHVISPRGADINSY